MPAPDPRGSTDRLAPTAPAGDGDRELPIIDAHHHLWRNNESLPQYASDFTADDLVAAAAPHNVVATIYVECGRAYRSHGPVAMRPVGETEFAVAQGAGVRGTGVCAGIVGYADLRLGAPVGDILDAHIEAGDGRFCGIRNSATWSDDPSVPSGYSLAPAGLLTQPAVLHGARQLVARGLTFDTWLFYDQMKDLCTFADAVPELTVVLDHIGGYLALGRRADDLPSTRLDWACQLREVARRPNVRLKVGGMGMRMISADLVARANSPSATQLAAEWQPLFEVCLDTFGPYRCMFESNYPVDGLVGSYSTLWDAFKIMASACSAHERRALFSATASATYGLQLESPGR